MPWQVAHDNVRTAGHPVERVLAAMGGWSSDPTAPGADIELAVDFQ